jgi:hypothetical protein
MISEGNAAHDDVRDALIREQVTVSGDAPKYAGEIVDSADKAEVQADVIAGHTVESLNGETFATLDRFVAADGGTTNDAELAALDDNGNPVANPQRETALTSANLRTSLNLAVMGFKVSELVIGLGLFMIVMGATFVLFLAPAVYYAAEVANERNKVVSEGATPLKRAESPQPSGS